MKNPEAVDALIRTRWAFAVGVLLGGALVEGIGLFPSITYGAGLLTMGLVAAVTERRRG